MQIRLQFSAPVLPDLLRVNLWASLTLLTGEIVVSRQRQDAQAVSRALYYVCIPLIYRQQSLCAILKAADRCQGALTTAKSSLDVGYDYGRFKVSEDSKFDDKSDSHLNNVRLSFSLPKRRLSCQPNTTTSSKKAVFP
jgi:hypothetical protein